MKLRVTYAAPGGEPVNVQITADATATAGAVARALAKGPGADNVVADEDRLTLEVPDQKGRARVLAPSQLLIHSGLLSGATVTVRPAPRRSVERGDAVALLRVVEGPDAGVEVPLPLGESVVGRAPACDVRLTDPLVSKLHARIEIRDGVEVVDTNSANGVVVGGVRVPRVTIGPGDVVQLGDSFVTVSYTRRPAELPASSTDIEFVRSPRVVMRATVQKFKVPQPPDEQQRARFPYLAMVAPLIMGAAMYAFTRSTTSLLFVALSPLLMLGNWVDQRVQLGRAIKKAAQAFDEQLGELDKRLAAAHDRQRTLLNAAHPSVTECVDHLGRLGDLLWSRRPEHPEFLQVRLGKGDVTPSVEFENADAPGRARYTQARDALLAKWSRLVDAPIIADLRSVGGVGISGPSGLAEGVARALVAQVATLHAPSEVVVTCLTSKVGHARWRWLEWLPHSASPQSPTGQLQLASDGATGRLLLDKLEELVASRLGNEALPSPRGPVKSGQGDAIPPLPAVLVVVDEPLVDLGRLTRLAERGPDVGVYVLWVAPDRQHVPAACRTFLDLGDGRQALVGMVRTEEVVTPVTCESLDAATAARVSRRLTPVVDVGTPTQDESDVPRMVSVISLLGPDGADDPEQILTRWRENGSWTNRSAPVVPRERTGDLRAIVGHTGTDPFTLDLRSQGPHALVGGTTGSGKSEFLQAWVLGLAHSYSPDRVTFLFVDYKGGAAFAKCTDLPHNVGMVTDLSPHLVRRALRSLRAEIHHREVLLQEKGVKDLIDFEATGDHNCPPSLIIVVDEFAALKSEVPDFYDGVVDVAQRGRSLGLHLIMATQRPTGVITDSLRANTNLRVALRMNDDHDSVDVLGDPMAARFDPSIPGRGGARTGPGRIARFQAGFPGARTYAQPPAPPIAVDELEFGLGRPWKVPPTAAASGPKPDKDIERVVAAVKWAAQLGTVPAPRRPWLEPLAAAYNLEQLRQRTDAELALGVMDDPANQRQVVAHFRPDDHANVLFVGAGGSGKTTALRTLAVAAGITPRGGPVHVYGLDFAGGGLQLLNDLPYVGSIVGGDDEERITRLLRHLLATIDERAGRYSAARASSLPEYRTQANRPDEPRILLLLDNFGAFRTEYDSTMARQVTYDAFRRVVSEGQRVGVHVAMTVDRGPAVPTAVASAFQQKVILRQTNEDGYLELNVPRDVLTPMSPPGRAMLQDNPEELQLAILGTDGSPQAQGKLIEQMAHEIAPFVKVRPAPIRALPTLVSPRELPTEVGGLPVLGVEALSLAPIGFEPRSPILIAGPRQSGRTSALRWFAESLRRWSPGIELYGAMPRRSALSSWQGWRSAKVGAAEVDAMLRDVVLPRLAVDADPDAKPRFALFVEGLPDWVNGPADAALVDAIGQARRNGHVVVMEAEISEAGGYGTLMTEARQARTGFILQPETADEGLFRTPLGRCARNDFPPGRGLWVRAFKTARVQVPAVD